MLQALSGMKMPEERDVLERNLLCLLPAKPTVCRGWKKLSGVGGGGHPVPRQNFVSEVLAITPWTRVRYPN